MASKEPDPFLIDDENPALTPDRIKNLRPAAEMLTEQGITPPRPVGRPKGADNKVPVTIRLDSAVLEHFKASGKGWQSRLNAALVEKIATDERA